MNLGRAQDATYYDKSGDAIAQLRRVFVGLHRAASKLMNRGDVLGMAIQLGLCNRFHVGCRRPYRWR
jgi:hypothetical protein